MTKRRTTGVCAAILALAGLLPSAVALARPNRSRLRSAELGGIWRAVEQVERSKPLYVTENVAGMRRWWTHDDWGLKHESDLVNFLRHNMQLSVTPYEADTIASALSSVPNCQRWPRNHQVHSDDGEYVLGDRLWVYRDRDKVKALVISIDGNRLQGLFVDENNVVYTAEIARAGITQILAEAHEDGKPLAP